MATLDTSQVDIYEIYTHYVGNRQREEGLVLSQQPTAFTEETRGLLLKYFLQSFQAHEFYSFTHAVDLQYHEIFGLAQQAFSSPDELGEISQHLARLLYDQSTHHMIKPGELTVVIFTNVFLDDDVTQAIGIFKSESDTPFLKMRQQDGRYEVNHEFGYDLGGLDKGCLIFNMDAAAGYYVLIRDTASKELAQFWASDFLQVAPMASEFHQTKQVMQAAKDFITKEMPATFAMNRADEIDLLNRSLDYFKNNETFDKQAFQETVFEEPAVIKKFQDFEGSLLETAGAALPDAFEINATAVKKQQKVFKSVLKLDRNFSVYIHGDRNQIEQGTDADGRKYYKLYYQNED